MTDSANEYLDIDRGIIADAYTSNETRDVLYTLCDTIGPRFAGTEGESMGAEFLAGKLEEYGLDKVDIEEFPFTAWRRGDRALLSIDGTVKRNIPCLALPYGGPTPPEGIDGELIDIGPGTADDIERLRDRIRNRIVYTDASGAHRSEIYGRVSAAGARGFILTGRTPGMILPTGCVSFGSPGKIPAVGIAYESGLLIKRLSDRGAIRVRIQTNDTIENGTSRNVVGEITSARNPGEFVIIGGHMDSHDVAPGAVDNASGTTCVVETARLLAARRERLERSVRFIAFGAEEVGLLGSYYHAKKHAEELRSARFMLNLDCVAMSRPKGLVFHKVPGAEAYVDSLREQMREPLPFYDRVHPHSDHFPFLLEGVITAEIGGGRFDPKVASFGHMAGDTADKVSLIDLREQSALAARLLVRAANDPNWPFAARTPQEVRALLEETGIDKVLAFERQSLDG